MVITAIQMAYILLRHLAGFIGTIKLQGSLATDPGANDWVDIPHSLLVMVPQQLMMSRRITLLETLFGLEQR